MEKARYEVTQAGHLIYFCVNSTRNTENMIDVLRDRFDQKRVTYKIHQTVKGFTWVIYDNYVKINKSSRVRGKKWVHPKTIMVIDNETGVIYESISECAIYLDLHKMDVYRQVVKKSERKRFSRYTKQDPILFIQHPIKKQTA